MADSCVVLKPLDFCTCPTPVAGGYQHAGSQATSDKLAAAVASVRGFFFYLSTFALALPLFVTMLVIAPFVALLDRHRRARFCVGP